MKGALFIRAFGEWEKVLPAVQSDKHGFLVLISAKIHPRNPKTVVGTYGRPKL